MKLILLIYAIGWCCGCFFGFYMGAKSEKFDRFHANLKLQECLEVIRND